MADHNDQEQQTLIATPGRYSLETVSTLGECLRRTRKVRPTPILYLYLGAQGWLESRDAYDLVVKNRSIELSWDAYLEEGQGPDPAGIYLFGSDGGAYRGFDVELEEEAYPPQRGTSIFFVSDLTDKSGGLLSQASMLTSPGCLRTPEPLAGSAKVQTFRWLFQPKAL